MIMESKMIAINFIAMAQKDYLKQKAAMVA